MVEDGSNKVEGITQPFQILEVKILTGKNRGEIFIIDHGKNSTIKDYQKVKSGEEIIVLLGKKGDKDAYLITDKFRLPSVLLIAIGFFALVIYLAKFKGASSIIGMIISLLILLKFIVPSIAYGKDPVVISLTGAMAIVFISIFLAHGFNKRTGIAVVSTFLTLLISVLLSYLFVELSKLSGSGSEDAYSLQFGTFAGINLKGLLLGGIIIGTLGVLDDITTAQSAAVDEISRANPNLTYKELYNRGLSIGREHIVSLVNTLILAYAGASLPIFFLFSVLGNAQPLWVTLNSEFIVEEVIRALVGSTALILAVPITTIIAASFFENKK